MIYSLRKMIPNHLISNINDQDKIWIYQADRILTKSEVDAIQSQADAFAIQWTAHNQKLNAKAFVVFNLFLIFSVNEDLHQASGCSIDKSVAFIKQMNEHYAIDFLNRNKVAVLINESVEIFNLNELADKLTDHETLVFNNLITTGREIKSNWILPANNSWHQRFLNQTA